MTDGENLIFLISQPRAGSTLTQKILGNHPDIHTASEPWIMLPPTYALRSGITTAEYGAEIGAQALKDFLNILPKGEDTYFTGMRKMYGYLYESALQGTGKKFFLDKTPRYYNIIPELKKTFPNAYYIILLRNPLAVLYSIIHTWTKEKWFNIYNYKNDLLAAPYFLLEGIKLLGQDCHIVHYENMLSSPEQEFNSICTYLNISYSKQLLTYEETSRRWALGDQDKIYRSSRPDTEHLNRWVSDLRNPQIWRLLYDYLEYLGSETISDLGYSFEELSSILNAHKPSVMKRTFTYSLSTIEKKKNPQYFFYRLYRLMRLLSR